MPAIYQHKGRLRFADGYWRMAYVTMERATGAQTLQQLADRLGLCPQRVHQIEKAGYAKAGCKPEDPPEVVGLAFRKRMFDPRPGEDTPESFYHCERFGRHF